MYNIRRMHRFHTDKVDGDTASISDAAQLHHLRDVLRLKARDGVALFDGRGNEYEGVISRIDRQKALVKITAAVTPRLKKTKITVACAVPKGSTLDDIIDYLTQLGVDAIVPMMTARVVVRLDGGRRESRLERWRKIAASAARQSQRSEFPVIEAITDIEAVISRAAEFDLRLIPTLSGERRPLKDILAESSPENILVMIGPEGDFTPEEVEQARRAGFVPATLGDTVLRVATAAVAVAGYIRLALGE
ncbi:MAG: hypothetical protein A2Z29_04220 [Chloroflexi bacterium RBG_16_56_11]|nr:MAG: hypothetical protein A2Z29_04220 [Chloroflexi bacterium RBG_16_56_11]